VAAESISHLTQRLMPRQHRGSTDVLSDKKVQPSGIGATLILWYGISRT